jgi:asparagine N-glycosylation enzyme membrane subunit Stt3
MRWILWRWFLGGGMRSFLAGYAGLPLLLGLLGTIVVTVLDRSMAESPIIVFGVLIACFVSPLGLILGMVRGFWPGWWGPWDGRLVFMGLMAGLVALVAAGRRLEKRNPVPDGGDGALHVPAACVVTARRAYRFPPVAWKQLIGPTLLVIAGAGLFFLGCAGLVLRRRI